MTDVVLVSACRTAVGTAYRGSLTETSAFDLAHAVVAESVAQAGLGPADADDVILGETLYGGGDVARYAAVTAGLDAVPGLAVNRHCASGLSAIALGSAGIASGMQDIVIAGGAHSTSTAPTSTYRVLGTDETRPWLSPSHPDRPDAPNMDMSITVGWNAAVEEGVSREEMDAWALRSHQRAIAAIDDGRFEEEILPIKVTTRDGSAITFATDEHPRRTTSMEKLAALPPLHPEIEGFSITAGNASGINDAAAAVVLMSADEASARGLAPLATIRGWAAVGVDPARTGTAPLIAIPKALARSGRTVADIDLLEVNEAFASVAVATTRGLGLDPEIVNPVGSGCSLGHPVGATGARMVVSLVHEMRRRGGGTAVAAMCAGGGMGFALVMEVAGA